MKQLNGYRASHRNKWYFLQHGILSIQELALLEFYADLFNFDPSQPSYGMFLVNFEEFATVFHCKSDTTVRNWHKKLLDVGFIEKTSNPHVFRLACCGRYVVHSQKIKGEANKYQLLEQNQSIDRILQSFGIDFQSIGIKVQPIGDNESKNIDPTTQTDPVANDSYKESDTHIPSGSQKIVVIRQAVRSASEYQKIYAEGGYGQLTPDDMRWIDEHITEEIPIENEKQENEIISLYFHGNRTEFQKNLLTN